MNKFTFLLGFISTLAFISCDTGSAPKPAPDTQDAEAGVTIWTPNGDDKPNYDLDDNTQQGSITITKRSKSHVEGAFTATSKRSTITDGTFAMKLTKIW